MKVKIIKTFYLVHSELPKLFIENYWNFPFEGRFTKTKVMTNLNSFNIHFRNSSYTVSHQAILLLGLLQWF